MSERGHNEPDLECNVCVQQGFVDGMCKAANLVLERGQMAYTEGDRFWADELRVLASEIKAKAGEVCND